MNAQQHLHPPNFLELIKLNPKELYEGANYRFQRRFHERSPFTRLVYDKRCHKSSQFRLSQKNPNFILIHSHNLRQLQKNLEFSVQFVICQIA